LKGHLQPHKWQILRLIQGTEGNGDLARFLESLMFQSVRAAGDDKPDMWKAWQENLLQGARNADAVDSELKGASAPGDTK
jgi:hypothetical protein